MKGSTKFILFNRIDGSNSWPDWFNPTNLSVSPSVKSLTTMWGKLKQN